MQKLSEIPLALSFNDVLLEPQFSTINSRDEVSLKTTIGPGLDLDIPLITANMDTVTGVEMAVAMNAVGGFSSLGRFDSAEVQADKVASIVAQGGRVMGVIGVKPGELERAELLLKAGSSGLHLDIAHAHSQHALDVIKECRQRFGLVPIMVGTVATYQAAIDLYEAGADAVRVGIGGGSTCTTRINAGSGVPQMTAICEVARARAEKFSGKFVVADGGAVNSGDIVKALAAGADAYMGGSLYAGTDEAPGEMIEVDGKMYKEYNGSTSHREKQRQLDKDGRNKEESFALHVEGVEAMMPAKGPVSEVVAFLSAGIRSGLSYSGARTIAELHEKARFIQITAAGYRESQSHDVITR